MKYAKAQFDFAHQNNRDVRVLIAGPATRVAIVGRVKKAQKATKAKTPAAASVPAGDTPPATKKP